MSYPTNSPVMSFDRFMALRGSKELDTLFEGKRPSFRSKVICYYKDKILFESDIFLGIGKLIVADKLSESEKSRVLGSIDRAGARRPYRCEVYPSVSSQQSEKYMLLGVKYWDIDKTLEEFPKFEDWFISWIDGRTVVPDTCIIYDHYLSEVILPRISKPLRIKIPRFVILELEAIGIREEEKRNRKKKEKNRENSEKRRLAFSAFNEVRTLMLETKAFTFSNPIKGDLLASFSQISGSKGIDGFIRLEIWSEMHRYSQPESNEKMILLTRDMMMACTASAEDIDVFYFCPAQPELTEFDIDLKKFFSIVTEIAVTFNEIRFEGLWDECSLIVEGMWSGKDIMDWGNKRLRFYLKTHTTNENETSERAPTT